MRSPVLLIALAVLALIAVGVLAMGAFPPRPHVQPITHTLPNDRFAPQ
jgi:hypothetical protein